MKLSRDTMHVDRQGDAAVAHQRNANLPDRTRIPDRTRHPGLPHPQGRHQPRRALCNATWVPRARLSRTPTRLGSTSQRENASALQHDEALLTPRSSHFGSQTRPHASSPQQAESPHGASLTRRPRAATVCQQQFAGKRRFRGLRGGVCAGGRDRFRTCGLCRVKVPQTPSALLVLSVCRGQPQN